MYVKVFTGIGTFSGINSTDFQGMIKMRLEGLWGGEDDYLEVGL